MDTAISVLGVVAIVLAIVFAIGALSFLIFARKFLKKLDMHITQVTSDLHAIKEQSVDFMADAHKLVKKANNIADTIEDLKQPIADSIDNIKVVSGEAKGILTIAREKTEEFSFGLKSITDSLYEGYMRVVQPIQKVSAIVSQVRKGANKMGEIFTKRKKKKQQAETQS